MVIILYCVFQKVKGFNFFAINISEHIDKFKLDLNITQYVHVSVSLVTPLICRIFIYQLKISPKNNDCY